MCFLQPILPYQNHLGLSQTWVSQKSTSSWLFLISQLGCQVWRNAPWSRFRHAHPPWMSAGCIMMCIYIYTHIWILQLWTMVAHRPVFEHVKGWSLTTFLTFRANHRVLPCSSTTHLFVELQPPVVCLQVTIFSAAILFLLRLRRWEREGTRVCV